MQSSICLLHGDLVQLSILTLTWGKELHGSIFFDNMQCLGNESRLVNCPNTGIARYNSAHSEDAGVTCLSEYKITVFR